MGKKGGGGALYQDDKLDHTFISICNIYTNAIIDSNTYPGFS